MHRAMALIAGMLIVAALIPSFRSSGAATPTPDLLATISALETQVAEAESIASEVEEPTRTPTMTPTVMPTPTRDVLLGPDQEHDEVTRRPRRTPTPRPTATLNAADDEAQAAATAIACAENNNWRCAVEAFEAAYARHPNDPLIRDDLYLSYIAYGVYLEFRRDLDGAREYYEKAYDLDPSREEAVFSLDRIRDYESVIFAEDFRDQFSFTEDSDAITDTFYEDEEFSIRVKEPGNYIYYLLEQVIVGRESYSIAFSCKTSSYGFCQILLGARPGQGATIFEVNPLSGQWRLYEINPSSSQYDEIASGFGLGAASPDSYLNLEARVSGRSVTLYIGRQEIDTVYVGSGLSGGSIGFGALMPFDSFERYCTITFDNLFVYRLSD